MFTRVMVVDVSSPTALLVATVSAVELISDDSSLDKSRLVISCLIVVDVIGDGKISELASSLCDIEEMLVEATDTKYDEAIVEEDESSPGALVSVDELISIDVFGSVEECGAEDDRVREDNEVSPKVVESVIDNAVSSNVLMMADTVADIDKDDVCVNADADEDASDSEDIVSVVKFCEDTLVVGRYVV